MTPEPETHAPRPDRSTSAVQPPDMLRDDRCRYCEQDVYLVFHPAADGGNQVEATCYNPQCPSRQTSPNEPHRSGAERP